MWQEKHFETIEMARQFIRNLGDKYEWRQVIVSNGFCIEYRKLKVY